MSKPELTWNLVGGFAVLCLGMVRVGAATPDSAKADAAADEIFHSTVIRHFDLEIPPSGLKTLRQYVWRFPGNQSERVPVPATVREGERVYTDVAVHLKGEIGSFRPVDHKPALTLKFDKFVPGQLFHGLAKISLNNEVQDPTFITDVLCRELYARAGVPVPRENYATVKLNGRWLGLYLMAEGYDKKFLKRHFRDATGNLYEAPHLTDIDRPLSVASGRNPGDRSDLKRMVAAARTPDPARRFAAIQQTLDVDRFVSLIALDVMMWNWDGYSINQNNYRVYHMPDQRRLVFMPHGMDQVFWNPQGPIVTGTTGLVARALLQTPEGRRLYLERFRQLRDRVFDGPAIVRRIRELDARIGPTVAREPYPLRAPYTEAVRSLCGEITARVRGIDQQLAGVTNLLTLGTTEAAELTAWTPRRVSGAPVLERDPDGAALHISTQNGSAGAWVSTVWLEAGTYVVRGRVKTKDVAATSRQRLKGAALRVVAPRKLSTGLDWDWFPPHYSNDRERRGDIASPRCARTRLTGTADWTEVTYEIELREPIADLEVLCELSADAGEAWFDLPSLRLTRK